MSNHAEQNVLGMHRYVEAKENFEKHQVAPWWHCPCCLMPSFRCTGLGKCVVFFFLHDWILDDVVHIKTSSPPGIPRVIRHDITTARCHLADLVAGRLNSVFKLLPSLWPCSMLETKTPKCLLYHLFQ